MKKNVYSTIIAFSTIVFIGCSGVDPESLNTCKVLELQPIKVGSWWVYQNTFSYLANVPVDSIAIDSIVVQGILSVNTNGTTFEIARFSNGILQNTYQVTQGINSSSESAPTIYESKAQTKQCYCPSQVIEMLNCNKLLTPMYVVQQSKDTLPTKDPITGKVNFTLIDYSLSTIGTVEHKTITDIPDSDFLIVKPASTTVASHTKIVVNDTLRMREPATGVFPNTNKTYVPYSSYLERWYVADVGMLKEIVSQGIEYEANKTTTVTQYQRKLLRYGAK